MFQVPAQRRERGPEPLVSRAVHRCPRDRQQRRALLALQRQHRRGLDAILVRDPDQALVEDPVVQPTQRDPVPRIIVVAMAPRNNVGSSHRRAALRGHDPGLADRAGVAIRLHHHPPKGGGPHLSEVSRIGRRRLAEDKSATRAVKQIAAVGERFSSSIGLYGALWKVSAGQ